MADYRRFFGPIAFVQPDVALGSIVGWAGSAASIPSGWHLCDGTNGTPDLRDKFIVGAGNTYNPADTGGNLNHTHPFGGTYHGHTIGAGYYMPAGTGWANSINGGEFTGTTDNNSSLPPYYAYCLIMKIKG